SNDSINTVCVTTANTSVLTTKTISTIESKTKPIIQITESSQTSSTSLIYSPSKTFEKEFKIESMNMADLFNILSSKFDLTDCLTNCSNHGQCNYDAFMNKLICVCHENYYGSSCKFDLRPCSSNPCLNNGKCSNININNNLNYECQCYGDYFSGRNCEIKKDVCLNETCSSKGECYDFEHTPKCKCFNMFSGDKCEIESNNFNIIKIVIRTSSILAIIILIIFYVLCFISDIQGPPKYANFRVRNMRYFMQKICTCIFAKICNICTYVCNICAYMPRNA
ncbi:unnamed protein product, partial [Brachionus calyciflorus]